MRGYKAFNAGWKCKDMQYEIGKSYEMEEELIMCERGYHFCANPIDVFGYYDFRASTLVAEVEAYGDIEQEGTKFVTNKIRIVKEISKDELNDLIHNANFNTGRFNTGNYNSGDFNSGNINSGNYNSGSNNSGSHNSGDYNTGNINIGYGNSGDCNKGNRNTGYHNDGDGNTGASNNGDCNTGSCNSGNYNSGRYNSGNCNTGMYNIGDRNTGYFNTNEPNMRMFNKDTGITFSDFVSNKPEILSLMYKISTGKLSEKDWKTIRALPNYDPEIFYECTGIRDEMQKEQRE